MTTTYSPDGQTAPVDEYTFPQDVIDLVVVETVNNPFATAADNIAWLFLDGYDRFRQQLWRSW